MVDAETGDNIGKLKDVLQPSSQDIYVVKRPEGSDVLIPVVSEFVKEVNVAEGFVKVHLIEGMLE